MTSQQKKRRLRNKCDRLLQELGRETYDKCLVCGKPMSCLHHYYPKSMASALRYDWENLIPLCAGCHFSHHNGNPAIHDTVKELKGKDWLEGLQIKRNQITPDTIEYYRDVERKLSGLV